MEQYQAAGKYAAEATHPRMANTVAAPQMRTIDGLLTELAQRIEDIANVSQRTREFRHRLLNSGPTKEPGQIKGAENPITVEARLSFLVRRTEEVMHELRHTVNELEQAA